jgi:hypothetical protein
MPKKVPESSEPKFPYTTEPKALRRLLAVIPKRPRPPRVMEGVKLRIELVDQLTGGKGELPLVPRFEFIALQLRKILELIAFGSLVANEKVYASTHADFAKEWNAKRLLAKLQKLNSQFYPIPVKQTPSNTPGILLKHERITSGYLTKETFVKVYQECSEFIHTKNPFSKADHFNFQERLDTFAQWRNQIIGLLNLHELHLFSDSGMAVCSMNDGGTNHVKVYRFQPPASRPGIKP